MQENYSDVHTKKTGKGPGTRYDAAEIRRIVDRVASGESVLKVAKDTGIPQPTVSRWVRESGIVATGGKSAAPDKTELQVLRKHVRDVLSYSKKLERLLISRMMRDNKDESLVDKIEHYVD